ncbi:MAG: hypothetical protein RL701_1345, partial [Pseudomonadota bacterium]
GKTTLTLNLAAMLARTGSRVLVVDADPQCNLTSYLIRDELIDALLEQAASSRGQTLWSAVRSASVACRDSRRCVSARGGCHPR